MSSAKRITSLFGSTMMTTKPQIFVFAEPSPSRAQEPAGDLPSYDSHPIAEPFDVRAANESGEICLAGAPVGEVIARFPLTDEHALKVILDSLSGRSPHTIRAYKKEFLRFLLWMRTQRTWAPDLLRRVSTEEIHAYAEFLKDPRPMTNEFLQRHGWKHNPFRKGLSDESRNYAIRLVRLMFARLQELESANDQPYSRFNPAKHVDAAYTRKESSDNTVEKVFLEEEWREILVTIETMPKHTEKQLKVYHRTRWIFHLTYHTYARIGDISKLRMSDFRRGSEGWSINLVGKGKLAASIVATNELMAALAVYRLSLGWSATPSFDEKHPAVLPFRGRAGADGETFGLTEQSIYVVCKDVYAETAKRLQRVNPEAAAKIRRATPHWLRHTSITHALEGGVPARYVRAQARHSSLVITARYDHTERRAWRAHLEKRSQTAPTPA